MRWILVMLAMAIGDVIWVIYIRRSSQGKAVMAATCSAISLLLGAIVVISYVADKWLLIPAVLGAWLGTYLAVRLDK